MKCGDYACLMVNTKTSIKDTKYQNFMVIVRCVAFGKRKNVQVERTWDMADPNVLVWVEYVHVTCCTDANGDPAVTVNDKAGAQFVNIPSTSLDFVKPYAHLVGADINTEPTSMMMFLSRDLNSSFKALSASKNSVQIRKNTLLPVTIMDTVYEMKRDLLPIICNICRKTITVSENLSNRERLTRMHMAGHIIANQTGMRPLFPEDPCMYCGKSIESSGCSAKIVKNEVVV